MADELKGLLEKIQEDGVRAAEEKARIIEDEALRSAQRVSDSAKREAQRMISEAESKIVKAEESSRAALKQASRDAIITLKKEISDTLERIISSHVHKALGAEEMAKILAGLIKTASSSDSDKISITLKKDDLDKVEKILLGELSHEIRKGITLKSSDEIRGGFLISYDADKSHYDFTDRALAEYISANLAGRLKEILKDSLSPGAKT